MLFIRHCEKLYENGCVYPLGLDPGITEESAKEAEIKFDFLIKKFKIPKKIVCSPYLRTRQTAEILQNAINKNFNFKVPIICDFEFSEYLGNQKKNYCQENFEQETLKCGIIPPESIKQFKDRVKKVCSKLEFGTWYVTHGFFMTLVSEYFGKKISYPKPIDYFAIQN